MATLKNGSSFGATLISHQRPASVRATGSMIAMRAGAMRASFASSSASVAPTMPPPGQAAGGPGFQMPPAPAFPRMPSAAQPPMPHMHPGAAGGSPHPVD